MDLYTRALRVFPLQLYGPLVELGIRGGWQAVCSAYEPLLQITTKYFYL